MTFIKDNIKKMADLLRSGYSMLNEACPECNNPIFRDKEGNLLCPTCNKKVVIVKNDSSFQESQKIDKSINSNTSETDKKPFNLTELNLLKEVINEKINWTTQRLKHEEQIDLNEKYINFITLLIELKRKIEDLK